MEKHPGRDLGDVWYDLSEKERMKVAVKVGRLESKLFNTPLPACGSVYFQRHLDGFESTDVIAGKHTVGDHEQLCIGPDIAQSWWYIERAALTISRGPCKYPTFQRNLKLL